MPQFEIGSFSSQLFWLFIVFSILYYIVAKLIAPRMESVLTTRNSYIDDNVACAQEYNDKVKSLENTRMQQSNQIHVQAEDMQKLALNALNAEFEKKQIDLSLIIDKKRENTLAGIKHYIDRFHDDSKPHCIKIAALIIQKISHKEADITLLEKIYGENK